MVRDLEQNIKVINIELSDTKNIQNLVTGSIGYKRSKITGKVYKLINGNKSTIYIFSL